MSACAAAFGWIVVAVLCVLAQPASGVLAEDQPAQAEQAPAQVVAPPRPLSAASAAESYVSEHLLAGLPADLTAMPDGDDPAKRVVRGAFIGELLSAPAPSTRLLHRGLQLSNVRIDGEIDLSGAFVSFPVSFDRCELDRLTADATTFQRTFTLTNCKVQLIDLRGATFKQGLTLQNSVIGLDASVQPRGIQAAGIQVAGDLDAARVVVHEASFQGAQVSGTFFLDDSRLEGPISLRFADLGQLQLNGAVVDVSTTPVGLSSMHVRGYLLARSAQFNAPVDLSYTRAAQLEMTDGWFCSKPSLDLTSVHVDGAALLSRTQVYGGVNMIHLDANDIELINTSFWSTELIDASDVHVAKHVNLTRAVFGGPIKLAGAAIGGRFVLTGVRLQLPTNPNTPQLNLERLQFQDIAAGETAEANTWAAINPMFERAHASSDNYLSLETYFRRIGAGDEANLAYIAARRVRAPVIDEPPVAVSFMSAVPVVGGLLGVVPAVADRAYDLGLGYGRYPQNAFYAWFFFVALGTLLFWGTPMLPDPPSAGATEKKWGIVTAGWYSLDAFAPVVSMHLADKWIPTSAWRLFYLRLHSLAGWIAVPIGLAAITGLLK